VPLNETSDGADRFPIISEDLIETVHKVGVVWFGIAQTRALPLQRWRSTEGCLQTIDAIKDTVIAGDPTGWPPPPAPKIRTPVVRRRSGSGL
jgi:hypothetical protein